MSTVDGRQLQPHAGRLGLEAGVQGTPLAGKARLLNAPNKSAAHPTIMLGRI